MSSSAAYNMYVFRSSRRDVPGPRLTAELAADVQAIAAPSSPGQSALRRLVLRALIRAGELESLLADAARPEPASLLARVADDLAALLVSGASPASTPSALRVAPESIAALDVPATVSTSPPEGFSFYALHPLDYARLADRLASSQAPVRVVGVRSIGTTLSAVTAAALRRRGIRADRITVRPSGHPYDRRVELGPQELRWVADGLAEGAQFWIVDEGPGFSGSSFLSTADALVAAGAPHARVVLLGSRTPDPDALVASDAARRWRSFRSERAQDGALPQVDAGEFIGGGAWRRHTYDDDEARWPPSWTTMERLKYISRDGSRLLKFEGMGRYGAECFDRAHGLSHAGFGPAPRDEGEGFFSYPRLPGRPLQAGDLSAAVLERLADYCAFRASAFQVPSPAVDELIAMSRNNFSTETGGELPDHVRPEIVRPAIVDGKMDPHEWLRSPSGELFKVDASGHGDDHFLPGPADIAWDLAGAMIEWRMDAAARSAFLERYRRRSGDRPEPRLPAYLAAYSLFRLGYAAMAAAALQDPGEARRLLAARDRYRAALLEDLSRTSAS
ncbi:hypothetical protein [Sorangium sp. So ce131]|uniref:hypothetical protein n=1 Tax=Sorangium sp. So ce131 TaxID=3133282 RepID=UPI003F5F95B9